MCTLKHFPYQIEHTLQWARDTFEGLFVQQSNALRSYLQNPDEFLSKLSTMAIQAVDILEPLKANLTTACPKNFDDCIAWARNLWQVGFCHSSDGNYRCAFILGAVLQFNSPVAFQLPSRPQNHHWGPLLVGH